MGHKDLPSQVQVGKQCWSERFWEWYYGSISLNAGSTCVP